MKVWILVLRILGYVWAVLAAVVVGAGLVGVWMAGGFFALTEVLSPFNVKNWVVTVLTFAPGVAALVWAEKLQERMTRRALRAANGR